MPVNYNRLYQLVVASNDIDTAKHAKPVTRSEPFIPPEITIDYNTTPADGIALTEQHFTTKIKQKSRQQSSLVVFKIYNLAEGTRAKFNEDNAYVQLRAGYGFEGRDQLPVVFFGQVSEVFSYRQGSEWITEVYCKDASASLKNTIAIVNFPKGTSHRSIITSMIGYLDGVSLGGVFMGDNADITLKRNYADKGRVRDLIQRFADSYGYTVLLTNHVATVRSKDWISRNNENGDSPEVPAPDAETAIGQGFSITPENIIYLRQERSTALKTSTNKSNKTYYSIKLPLDGRLSLETFGVSLQGFEDAGYEIKDGNFAIEDIEHTLSFEGGEWTTLLRVYEVT